VPRPLLYVLTQEEEEGGAGGSVWVDWPTHTEEREERAGVDVEEKINGSGGGATPPSCPVSHDECCPVEIYGCQSPPLGTALHRKRQNSLSFFFSPHDSAVDEISFISIIFNWQLNSENDVSLLLSAISNDFKIIRRE
jgi:hypothetical protein